MGTEGASTAHPQRGETEALAGGRPAHHLQESSSEVGRWVTAPGTVLHAACKPPLRCLETGTGHRHHQVVCLLHQQLPALSSQCPSCFLPRGQALLEVLHACFIGLADPWNCPFPYGSMDQRTGIHPLKFYQIKAMGRRTTKFVHANFTQVLFMPMSVKLDPQLPILFLLRVKAVSIPKTWADHPFPRISSSIGSASCSSSRHPPSPSSSSSSFAETFSLLALNKNRSVVSNLLCDDFTIFCQT